MGRLREVINAKARVSFEIYLEDGSFYEDRLQECGFTIDKIEVIKTNGMYEIEPQIISLRREFIVIVARKPQNMIGNSA